MEATETEITLRQPRYVPAGFALAAVLLGTGIGWVAPALASWLVGVLQQSPLPVPGLLEVVAGLPVSWSVPGGVLLGVVGAAVVAGAIVHEALQLTVARDHLEYRQEGREGWIDHADVARIYRDGRYAVVLDEQTRVLVRLDADALNWAVLGRTLREYGYPWAETDPFEADYQRWMHGRPGFTAAEDELIGRWQEVRRKNPERARVEAALREAHLAVRFRDDRVQVRRTGESGHGTHRRPAAS